MRNKLLAKLHILLKEKGAEQHKAVLYAPYGATSARELTDAQLSELIMRLEEGRPSAILTPRRNVNDASPEIKRLRSEVLSILTRSPQARDPRKRGLGIPNDWPVLNPFIEQHTGTALYNLDVPGLQNFRKKLYSMRQSGWSYKCSTTVDTPPVHAPRPPRSYPIILRGDSPVS